MERNESVSYNAEGMDKKTRLSSQNTQLPKHHRQPLLLNRETINLESHQLIWLSSSTEFEPMESLRKIVDYVHLFDNVITPVKCISSERRTPLHFWCVHKNLRTV
jgi:hypothetical protein